jgi:hypothetical protein
VLYHARRLAADVRGIRRWVLAVALATAFIAVGATYLAAFSVPFARDGTLAIAPPDGPIAFIRGVDPEESIDIDGSDGLPSVLEQPGLRVLLSEISRSSRMYLLLGADLLTTNGGEFAQSASHGRVVVAGDSRVLGERMAGLRLPTAWGSMRDGPAGVTDSQFGPLNVTRVSSTPLDAVIFTGGGRRTHTGDDSLLLMTPKDAARLGAYPPASVTQVVDGFVCYCAPDDLVDLTARMTDAEHAAGLDRIYYPVGYAGLIGPTERAQGAVEVLGTAFAIVSFATVCCFGLASGEMFWRRCRKHYGIERLHGASEFALQLRQQTVVAAAVTGPAMIGFLVVDVTLRMAAPEPPWTPHGGLWLIGLAIAIQLGVSGPTVVGVHRLSRWAGKEAARG